MISPKSQPALATHAARIRESHTCARLGSVAWPSRRPCPLASRHMDEISPTISTFSTTAAAVGPELRVANQGTCSVPSKEVALPQSRRRDTISTTRYNLDSEIKSRRRDSRSRQRLCAPAGLHPPALALPSHIGSDRPRQRPAMEPRTSPPPPLSTPSI